MKDLCVFALTVLFAFATHAQNITAGEMLDKLTCIDSTCFQPFIQGKGFEKSKPTQNIGKDFKRYNYTASKRNCKGILEGEDLDGIIIYATPKGIISFIYSTPCPDIQADMLKDFKKKGFVPDITDGVIGRVIYKAPTMSYWELWVDTEKIKLNGTRYTFTLNRINSIF